jgi:hypothetical protein
MWITRPDGTEGWDSGNHESRLARFDAPKKAPGRVRQVWRVRYGSRDWSREVYTRDRGHARLVARHVKLVGWKVQDVNRVSMKRARIDRSFDPFDCLGRVGLVPPGRRVQSNKERRRALRVLAKWRTRIAETFGD